jgi:hypothetical protein
LDTAFKVLLRRVRQTLEVGVVDPDESPCRGDVPVRILRRAQLAE